MKPVYEKDKYVFARFLSLLITLLGYTMVIVNRKNNNPVMMGVSLFYGSLMLATFIIITIKKICFCFI